MGFEIHQLEVVVGMLTPRSLQPGAWKEMLLVFVGIWIPGAADGILFICKQKNELFLTKYYKARGKPKYLRVEIGQHNSEVSLGGEKRSSCSKQLQVAAGRWRRRWLLKMGGKNRSLVNCSASVVV